MILVGQLDSPYVRRVAISLRLLDIPFERNPISVFGNADEVRRVNPLGRVPALLLDDGEVLIDSSAILDHLDEIVGPTRALLPPSGADRRRALRIIALALGVNDKAVATIYERTQRPAENVQASWLERSAKQLTAGLDALEAETSRTSEGSPWLVGDRAGQADITIFSTLAFLEIADALVQSPYPDAARFPGLMRLAAACRTLAAVQATEPPANERPPRK